MNTTDERLGLGSASSAERDVNCPGSRSLIASIPPKDRCDGETAIAKDGTAMHSALETGQDSELDEEHADIVQQGRAKQGEVVRQWLEENGLTEIPDGTIIIREERLWIRGADLQPIYSAKVDFALIIPARRTALVIDYKTGFLSPTKAGQNWQLRVQAICAHEEHDVVQVRVATLQARTGAFDPADYDLNAIERSKADLMQAVWRSGQPNAPRYAGTWCRYCPAKAHCQEFQAWAQVAIPTNLTATEVDIVEWAGALTHTQLSRIWEKRKLIEAALDAVTARLKGMPPEMLALLGLKLKDGKKRISVGAYVGAVGLIKASGLPLDDGDIWEASQLSRTALAEGLQKATQLRQNAKISKKTAQEAIDTALKPLLTEKICSPEIEKIE